MREYEEVKSKVLMIAGEEVRKRIDELQSFEVRHLWLACGGVSLQSDNNSNPSDLLIEAMRSELDTFGQVSAEAGAMKG